MLSRRSRVFPGTSEVGAPRRLHGTAHDPPALQHELAGADLLEPAALIEGQCVSSAHQHLGDVAPGVDDPGITFAAWAAGAGPEARP